MSWLDPPLGIIIFHGLSAKIRNFQYRGCACDVTNPPHMSVTNQIDSAAILSDTECQLKRTAPYSRDAVRCLLQVRILYFT